MLLLQSWHYSKTIADAIISWLDVFLKQLHFCTVLIQGNPNFFVETLLKSEHSDTMLL